MSIINEITRIQNAKAKLKLNLENKGVSVGDEKLDVMVDFVSDIKGGIDTTDGTATLNDILLGKTAYVNDEKIEGIIETYNSEMTDGAEIINNTLDITANGEYDVKEYAKANVNVKSNEDGAKLNIEYANTPPADTSKLWLNCQEPSGVEVQNYLGECAIDEVLEYGAIENPTTYSYFRSRYFNTCYIGNNQIAIVGYNHIRIYDLTTKSYIADYTINVGTNNMYINIILKDNVLYFGYANSLYSFDLSTQTLTELITYTYYCRYIYFNNENEIHCIMYNNSNYAGYIYKFNLTDKTYTTFISSVDPYTFTKNLDYEQDLVKVNDMFYHFEYTSNSDPYKLDLINGKASKITSFIDFVEKTSTCIFENASAVYDNERFIYLIGGGNTIIGYDNLIKYDTVNDTFELLDTKLLSGKCNALSVLVDNRVYMFGGDENTTYGYGRKNYIDYFDLKYPLNENNAIVTINNSTDSVVTLINEDTIKLKSNVASAYIGNADNLATKVNAYYYKITGEKPSGYSSLIFDKNTILKNYSTLIEMAESSNMDMLSFPFKNSEGIVYALGVTYISRNDSLDIVIIDEDINRLFSVSINNNGDFNSTSIYGDCIWIEGDTYTFEFGEYLEFTNEMDGEILTTTMDDFALMGTAIGRDGGFIGYWKGVNTADPFKFTTEDKELVRGSTAELQLTYNSPLNWAMDFEVSSDITVSNVDDIVTIKTPTDEGTYTIDTFAYSYDSTYTGSFNITAVNAVEWSSIPAQTVMLASSETLDLSTYVTKCNGVTDSDIVYTGSVAGAGYNISTNGSIMTINNQAASHGSSTFIITATINGVSYSTTTTLNCVYFKWTKNIINTTASVTDHLTYTLTDYSETCSLSGYSATYSVTSSNDSAVMPEITTGNVLTLDCIAAGTATITVTATVHGETYSTSFIVTTT